MSLSNLPKELLLNIALHLDDAGMNAFCRTNNEIYEFLNMHLYRRDMTDDFGYGEPGESLLWGATFGVEATVKKAIAAGRQQHLG